LKCYLHPADCVVLVVRIGVSERRATGAGHVLDPAFRVILGGYPHRVRRQLRPHSGYPGRTVSAVTGDRNGGRAAHHVELGTRPLIERVAHDIGKSVATDRVGEHRILDAHRVEGATVAQQNATTIRPLHHQKLSSSLRSTFVVSPRYAQWKFLKYFRAAACTPSGVTDFRSSTNDIARR